MLHDDRRLLRTWRCSTVRLLNVTCNRHRRFWAERIAQAGCVGLVLSQSPEYVAPHGAREAILGTNPIAVGAAPDFTWRNEFSAMLAHLLSTRFSKA